MANGAEEPGYLTWGAASAKLLRTMRLEAARSGHDEVMPAHLLLAALDQPETHQALRAIHQAPDVYTIRARVSETSLAPSEYDEALPLSRPAEHLLDEIRRHRTDEEPGMLYLIALKQALSVQACRSLMKQGGSDPGVLEQALARIE
jgi:hypothetical protein